MRDSISVGVQIEPNDPTRAVIIDLDGDQCVTLPSDPLEMRERNRLRRADECRTARAQIDSRHAIAMRHVGDSFIADGKAEGLYEAKEAKQILQTVLALRETVGPDEAVVLRDRLLSQYQRPFQMPPAQALLLALRQALPTVAEAVLQRSRNLYVAEAARQ